MLFQEQTMQACNKVFGMTLDEAEVLRRVIGKKKVDEIPAWKEKIFSAAAAKGLNESVAEYFWNVVEAGASYQFNKSHSVSYATLAAKTVFLKYKYPQEFFISLLEIAEFEPDPLTEVAAINKELKDFGIKLLPPSLEKSHMNFCIEGENIRYGLGSIKGISSKSLQSLVDFRGAKTSNKFEVFAAAKNSKINVSVLAALIQAGTMDSSGNDRSRMVLEAQGFNLMTEREKRNFLKLGERFQYDLLNGIAEVVDKKILGDDNKLVMPEKRLATFKKDFQKYVLIYRQNKKYSKLAKWWYETTLIGYSYSHDLKDCFTDEFDSLVNLLEINDLPDKEKVQVVGQVEDFFTRTSANGNKYMSLLLADDYSSQRMLLMDNRKEARLTQFLANQKLAKKDIVIVRGSKSGDTFFIDTVTKVDCSIYMKPKDLKKD